MPDAAYWDQRFKQVEQSAHREAEKVYADIDSMYKAADREITQKISTWYQRFAVNNGVSMADARKLLDAGQLKEFKWTVQDYIRHGRENGISADWSKQLENASARFHITRLQALQLDLQQSVEVLYGGQSDALDALMKKSYLDSYYKTAFEIQKGIGIGWDIAKVDGKQLETLLRKPWTVDGRNFSDKIWNNKSALIGELQRTLQQNLILGRSPDHMIEEFSHRLGVSESNAARLLYTETAYFSALSQGDSFKALGVDNVVFVATLDERTSDICQQMDGTIIPMKDYNPGVTVPPLHPRCRSTTAPYFKDLEGIGERAARDPEDGKTYWIPKDTKYPDWKATFVNGGSKGNLTPATAIPLNHACELATKFGTAYYNELHRMVGQSTNPELQRVWAAHESEIHVGDANCKGHEHCMVDTIYVNGRNDAKGSKWQNPYQVTFHESGHAIDAIVKNQAQGFTRHYSSRYQNGLFPQTIKDEVNAIVSAKDADLKAQWKAHDGDWAWLNANGLISDGNYQFYQRYGRWLSGEPKYSKSMAYAAVEREIRALSPLQKADLSDIMEGATGGKIQAGFGHGKTYWKQRTVNGVSDGLATEAFAEMIDSEMANPDSLATLKEWLPKSYGVFCDMLKTIQ